MDAGEGSGWEDVSWQDWADHRRIRAALDAGADPNEGLPTDQRPLHLAAERGSAQVVAELAARVDDVDAEQDGRTALWAAVFAGRPDNARVLAEAGADPWRPMMAGWSPGRLSLAGPTPGLFAPRDGTELSAAETAAVTEAKRLIEALGESNGEGTGLACVTGISGAEAGRRLHARPAPDPDPGFPDKSCWPAPPDDEELAEIVGATDVPGGCVVTQPGGYAPSRPGVEALLSEGTVCYGLYANPKSGPQGSVYRDGVMDGWDLSPGSAPALDDSPWEILLAYLYRDNPMAYACAYTGLRLTDARAITGPPDAWLRLPARDYGQ
jgi:hypothetical protein